MVERRRDAASDRSDGRRASAAHSKLVRGTIRIPSRRVVHDAASTNRATSTTRRTTVNRQPSCHPWPPSRAPPRPTARTTAGGRCPTAPASRSRTRVPASASTRRASKGSRPRGRSSSPVRRTTTALDLSQQAGAAPCLARRDPLGRTDRTAKSSSRARCTPVGCRPGDLMGSTRHVPRPVPQPFGTGMEGPAVDRARRPRHRALAVVLATLLVPLVVGSAAAAPGNRPAVTVTPTVTGASVSVRADVNRGTNQIASCTYVLDANAAVLVRNRSRQRQEGQPLHHRPVEPGDRQSHDHRHDPADRRRERQRLGFVHDRAATGVRDRVDRPQRQPYLRPGG